MSQAELNCKLVEAPKTSDSNEDLSQYTDANESISAPIELLAEFLSAVMVKSYKRALDYCKQILLYEPNNATAKEFYPLIVDKLQMNADGEYDESTPGSSTNSSTSCSEDNCSCNKNKDDSDATSASYSSLEDEEADIEIDDFKAGDEVINLKAQSGNVDEQNNEILPTQTEKTNNKISTTTVDILIHSSPTVTLKRENTIVLSRNETYTKNISEQISNTNESKIQAKEKTNNSNNKKPTKKRGNININANKKLQKKVTK